MENGERWRWHAQKCEWFFDNLNSHELKRRALMFDPHRINIQDLLNEHIYATVLRMHPTENHIDNSDDDDASDLESDDDGNTEAEESAISTALEQYHKLTQTEYFGVMELE